ncbi:hypothetical protein GNF76_25385 [Pseudomonas sp. CCM 7893]|uniref:Secreted protein n=1 Tax=Pseudomonas spelaei TaxID=1055469 RepID=A0A6I3WKD7_9PSED|nr:hypothetical protein [Pseudomonas spelaei]MUF07692.1 hypothetical protein [Pseudomonas spelaei]QLG94107.1 hypothetical protein HZF02_20100 [Pseudomonas yamanorum]
MRLKHLLALAAPFALLLPLSVQAAWPEGGKSSFQQDCQKGAMQNPNVNPAQAKAHCECGANALEKNFSKEELSKLMDRNTPPDNALLAKAQSAIQSCKVVK